MRRACEACGRGEERDWKGMCGSLGDKAGFQRYPVARTKMTSHIAS